MNLKDINNLLNKNNFDFHYFNSVESTMTEVKKINFKKNICLFANEQTRGFGRRGSKWESPKGNVYISLLLVNELDTRFHFINNAYTTNIICDLIESICNLKTEIKWPNDILIHNKKISGIISETYIKDSLNLINTGFGINIISSPNLNDYETTNINKYYSINNIDFTYKLMEKYLKNIQLKINKPEIIMKNYKLRLKFLGKKIKLELNNKNFQEGIFHDLSQDGSILFKQDSKIENIYNARILK
tara:strand:+ start:261 stop:995 length:735 start_codon:yes stop_codon:yes gene_type:complete